MVAIEDFYTKSEDCLNIQVYDIVEEYVSNGNPDKILTFYRYKDIIYDEVRAMITDRNGKDIVDDAEPIEAIIARCGQLTSQMKGVTIV